MSKYEPMIACKARYLCGVTPAHMFTHVFSPAHFRPQVEPVGGVEEAASPEAPQLLPPAASFF